MITGLLFTLAQRPPKPANESNAEGRLFPPAKATKPKRNLNIVRLTRNVSLALALVGTGLLVAAAANWSFNPAAGLRVHLAAISFTLPVGVSL